MLKSAVRLSIRQISLATASAAVAAEEGARSAAVTVQQIESMNIKVAPVRPASTQAAAFDRVCTTIRQSLANPVR